MLILYPTETLYALGANAFNAEALASLYKLKGRSAEKSVSVLVRNVADIERYAYLPPKAKVLVENFLPGPLTLVLKVRDAVPHFLVSSDSTLGFRISSDVIAQKVIGNFMEKYDAPLTCTSANLSGENTLPTVSKILKQFGSKSKLIDKIYDDGPRAGASSTVVSVIGEEVKILRAGKISKNKICEILNNI